MGKLKNEMVAAEEQFWNEASPDLSMDDLIRDDVLFRYDVDLDAARSMQNLMKLCTPPEALYVSHPEIYDLWMGIFLIDTQADESFFQRQLDLFEGRKHG
jgi:hypothetical protein